MNVSANLYFDKSESKSIKHTAWKGQKIMSQIHFNYLLGNSKEIPLYFRLLRKIFFLKIMLLTFQEKFQTENKNNTFS